MNKRVVDFLRSRGFLLFALCFAAFTGMYLMFMWRLGLHRIPAELYRIAGNALIIFIPYWFMGPRWRRTAIIPVWILGIWILANLWYYGFWNDLLSPAAINMTGNVGPLLLNSVRSLWTPADLLFLLIPAAVTALTFTALRTDRPRRYSLRLRLAYIAFSLLAYVAGLLLGTRSELQFMKAKFGHCEKNYISGTIDRFTREKFNNFTKLRDCGLLVMLYEYAGELIGSSGQTVELNDDEINEISQFIAAQTINPIDSFAGKNLILIIVESLNAEVIGKTVGDLEITPVLNSLIGTENTVSALKVVTQIKDGGSSDGQLTINTGLLPVKHGSTAMKFAKSNVFPNINDALPENYANTAIFAESRSTWKKGIMFQNYGFKRIIYGDETYVKTGSDAVMFKTAEAVVDTISRPFFIEMTSISMHAPFREDAVKMDSRLEAADIPDNSLRDYYNVTHYFDTELGKFMDYLKRSGLWDNTVLVITSDHNVVSFFEAGEFVPAVFIATNTGRTESIDRIVGQANIFPTILEIIGRSDSLPAWRGLAPSMLHPGVDGTIDGSRNDFGPVTAAARERMIKAYELSDKIHRGQYFGGK